MNILVVTTEDYLTLRLLKCLAPLKAEVHILGPRPSRALSASRYCRRYHAASPAGLTDGMAIEKVCRDYRMDVVLPSGIESVFLLSALQENWASVVPGTRLLPTPPPEQLRMLNNKWAFAQFLQQLGLPLPKSRVITLASEALAVDLTYPVVVKPLEMDASRGVKRCETPQEASAHAKQFELALPLLVQEYVPGEDIGLGIAAHQGKIVGWTIQRVRPDGQGVDFIEQPEALEIGRCIMATCKYEGIAHFDMRVDSRDGSVKVLECNPRFWASLPFSLAAGVNFADLGIRLALDVPTPEPGCSAVSLAFPTKALWGGLHGMASGLHRSEASRSALRATLADPMPLVYLGAGKIRRRLAIF